MNTHDELDARSFAMHRLITQKIERDPSLMQIPASNLTRWQHDVCANSQAYISAWQALLRQGLQASLRVATEDSEYARAMRQCSPFAGVLTPAERWQFLRDWKAQHEAR